MSIDAAFLVAPTAQPKSAGSKAASADQDAGSFATTLDAVTSASEDAATANAVGPAQTATAAADAVVTVPTQLQLIGDTVADGAAVEAQPANPATTPDPAIAAATPSPAAAQAQATSAAVAATTQAAARAGATAAPTSGEPAATDGAEASVANATSAANTTTAASVALPVATATSATAAETGTPVAQPIVDGAADAPPVDAAKVDAKPQGQQTVAPAAASTQTAAQAQMKAQAADVAIQAADIAQSSASPQASAADVLASTATTSTETTRAQATPAALQSAPAATIQVYTRMIERADGRAQRFEVRLDPAELGRVDVRIEVGADRKVHAVLAAHDSAALTDLMRGQRALERALSDAGIDLADNGVRFELAADNGRSGAGQQRDSDGNPVPSANVWRNFDVATVPVSGDAAAVEIPAWRTKRLDLVA